MICKQKSKICTQARSKSTKPCQTKTKTTQLKILIQKNKQYKKLTILAKNKFSFRAPARPHAAKLNKIAPSKNETVNTQNLIELSKW